MGIYSCCGKYTFKNVYQKKDKAIEYQEDLIMPGCLIKKHVQYDLTNIKKSQGGSRLSSNVDSNKLDEKLIKGIYKKIGFLDVQTRFV